MSLIHETIVLPNGYHMPKLGFGTHAVDKSVAYDVIKDALNVGYRHIETAPIYLNEKNIAKALKESNIPREDLFITSKIPPHIKTYEGVKRVAERIMKNLAIDYIDCLLINAPTPWGKEDEDYSSENIDVWRALESLYNEEIVGSIGISNFTVNDINNLIPHVTIKPHVHQLGIFIGHTLDDIVTFSKSLGMVIQGHSPLARSRLLKEEIVKEFAEKENLTPSQLALRYTIEKGVYPIVKTTSIERMKENIMLDSPLKPSTIKTLDALSKDVRDYSPPNAKWVL